MKKLILLLLFFTTLQAQVGEIAYETQKAVKESQWQNWTFAGVTLVTLALGIFLCTVNNGHAPHEQ